MVTEEPKDPLRRVNWKAVGIDMQKSPCGKPGIMKRLPRKISLNPDCYFLPPKLLPYNIAPLGACIAVGYITIYVIKKIRVDGDIIWILTNNA